jgi:hypothetical protein
VVQIKEKACQDDYSAGFSYAGNEASITHIPVENYNIVVDI